MSGKQAKIITPGMLKRMMGYVPRSRYPRRNRVIVLLSAKAGLRACEIADLEWSMVLDGKGHIGWSLNVWDAVAKKNSGRRIPLHPDLRRALIELSHIASSASRAARRTRADVASSRRPLAASQEPVGASGTYSSLQVTARLRRRKGTSTATLTPSAG